MKNENLIHVRLEYNEAVQSKREILLSEMSLLRIMNTIKRYHSFRTQELKIKIKLHRKIKGVDASLRKLQTALPKLKMPEILKEHEEIDELETETEEKHYDDDLKSQLQEIQDKLRSLGE